MSFSSQKKLLSSCSNINKKEHSISTKPSKPKTKAKDKNFNEENIDNSKSNISKSKPKTKSKSKSINQILSSFNKEKAEVFKDSTNKSKNLNSSKQKQSLKNSNIKPSQSSKLFNEANKENENPKNILNRRKTTSALIKFEKKEKDFGEIFEKEEYESRITEMFRKEINQHKEFYFDSNLYYVKYRRYLIEFMIEIGEYCNMNQYTIPLAVLYLDRILSKVKVKKHSLYLVSACCSLFASKFNDRDVCVPTLRSLRQQCLNSYNLNKFRLYEIKLLHQLDQNLCLITPMHFLSLQIEKLKFSNQFMSTKNKKQQLTKSVKIKNKNNNNRNQKANSVDNFYTKNIFSNFEALCREFCLESLLNYELQSFHPSDIAAGCLASACKCLKYESLIQNEELESITQKTYDEKLKICEQKILRSNSDKNIRAISESIDYKYEDKLSRSPTSIVDAVCIN